MTPDRTTPTAPSNPTTTPTPAPGESAPRTRIPVPGEWLPHLAASENMVDTAGAMGMSQSALSRRLRGLEAQVGTELFDRHGRHLRLNERGALLAQAATRAAGTWSAAVEEARRLMDADRGTVRLAFMHSLGTWMVPELIRGFRTNRPRVRFELVQGAAQLLIDRVALGEADIALIGPRPLDAAERGMGWLQLAEQRLALAVPDDHPWAGRDSMSIADAATAPFVAMLPGYGTRMLLDELAAGAGFRPQLAYETMELTTVAGLVAAGLGVALVPMGDPNLLLPGVRLIPLREARVRELGMVWRPGHLSPAAQALCEHIHASRSPGP